GAAETTRDFLGWLERHDRRVINGLGAFKLELSKARQIEALESHGFAVPRTSVVEAGEGRFGALVEAASGFDGAFVVKPNRGGKGLGVEKFDSVNQLEIAIEAELIEPSPDGLMLVQRYIEPADPSITRCEFVGGEFLYAIRADTSGGFELCPADGCGEGESEDPQAKFSLREDVPREQIEACEAFCSSEGIEIAGIEFIEDAEGKRWTYDVNCNTNYSPSVEANHGLDGAAAVAGLVRRELEKLAPS
ncbi:MAG: alpha-L-glutamate ligase, partial [Planctomycetota bacterium]